jgi:hypothetical protein
MANMQTECLNKHCSKPVSGGDLWCSMECKRQFLLDHYSDGQCHMWFDEANKDFRKRQKKVMAEIKESGLSVRDFLLSMGEFKEADI